MPQIQTETMFTVDELKAIRDRAESEALILQQQPYLDKYLNEAYIRLAMASNNLGLMLKEL